MTSTLTPARGGQDARVAVEDEQLVREAQAGHRPAFEQLVRRHADRLHAVVRRLVDTREEDAAPAARVASPSRGPHRSGRTDSVPPDRPPRRSEHGAQP